MNAELIIAFLLFALTAAGTPGPSNVLVMATGASVGLTRALPCLFGVVIGMAIMIAIVTAGLGSMVLAHPKALIALNWIGAGFLLWLAWKIASADPAPKSTISKPVGFWGAAGFQWVNPKSWIVSSSAAGTYLQADAGSAVSQAILFGGLFAAAALPAVSVWLYLGATIQKWLTTDTRQRTFNIIMGLLLAASVFMILS